MAKEAGKDSRLMRSVAPATPGGWRSPPGGGRTLMTNTSSRSDANADFGRSKASAGTRGKEQFNSLFVVRILPR